MTPEERQLLNWTLSQITNTPREQQQEITPEEIAILKSGAWGDKTTFGLPEAISSILDKVTNGKSI